MRAVEAALAGMEVYEYEELVPGVPAPKVIFCVEGAYEAMADSMPMPVPANTLRRLLTNSPVDQASNVIVPVARAESAVERVNVQVPAPDTTLVPVCTPVPETYQPAIYVGVGLLNARVVEY